jgi:shikimate kinase
MKDNRSLLSVRKSVGKLAQSISKITKQINKVRNSETLSSSEKKDRLNTLINRRNQIAERVERLLDRAGK